LVENGKWPLVSVKTTKPIPKDKIFDVLKEIKQVKINAPVKLGQKLMKNVANTGIDVVATKTVEKK
jgi:CxxC motif-containing protein